MFTVTNILLGWKFAIENIFLFTFVSSTSKFDISPCFCLANVEESTDSLPGSCMAQKAWCFPGFQWSHPPQDLWYFLRLRDSEINLHLITGKGNKSDCISKLYFWVMTGLNQLFNYICTLGTMNMTRFRAVFFGATLRFKPDTTFGCQKQDVETTSRHIVIWGLLSQNISSLYIQTYPVPWEPTT